ncbi:hypothetical protein AQ1_02392 [alpha proteobacterium Q-1]|nr:hypothetical protein AQ1_02392 [alpha proteobacterium Q-1]
MGQRQKVGNKAIEARRTRPLHQNHIAFIQHRQKKIESLFGAIGPPHRQISLASGILHQRAKSDHGIKAGCLQIGDQRLMAGSGGGPQFGHIRQHRDPARALVLRPPGQHPKACPQRHRIGIIGIIDEAKRTIAQIHEKRPPAPAPGSEIRQPQSRHPQIATQGPHGGQNHQAIQNPMPAGHIEPKTQPQIIEIGGEAAHSFIFIKAVHMHIGSAIIE